MKKINATGKNSLKLTRVTIADLHHVNGGGSDECASELSGKTEKGCGAISAMTSPMNYPTRIA